MTKYRYQIYCETEGKYKYVIDSTQPTQCPDDPTHTLYTVVTRSLNEYNDNFVEIGQESKLTGGNFAVESRELNIPAYSEVIYDRAWPFPTNALSIFFNTTSSNRNDQLSLVISPDTAIGGITQAVTTTDTSFFMSAGGIPYIRPGYWVRLVDGTNSTEYLQIHSLNPITCEISVSGEIGYDFSPLTPTIVEMGIFMMKEMFLEGPYQYRIGDVTIGSSYLPENTIVRIQYKNNGGLPKKFLGTAEYLY